MKALVTGANGTLGRYLCPLLRQAQYQVHTPSRQQMDICDYHQVQKQFAEIQPQLVFHLAALTDVDHCQKYPDEAYATNTLASENIARQCLHHGANLVYISTGMVYSGEKPTPYIEYDDPNPLNTYGRSKLMGEKEIYHHLAHSYIFYTTWLFGGGPQDKKFITKMLALGRQKSEIQVVSDKIGSPCYALDFAKGILQVLALDRPGKYHLANHGFCSRAQLTKKVFTCANIACQVREVDSSHFPQSAPRPRNESLRNYKLQLLGCDPMRSWERAVEEYIAENF